MARDRSDIRSEEHVRQQNQRIQHSLATSVTGTEHSDDTLRTFLNEANKYESRFATIRDEEQTLAFKKLMPVSFSSLVSAIFRPGVLPTTKRIFVTFAQLISFRVPVPSLTFACVPLFTTSASFCLTHLHTACTAMSVIRCFSSLFALLTSLFAVIPMSIGLLVSVFLGFKRHCGG